jgi:hypothetical protein
MSRYVRVPLGDTPPKKKLEKPSGAKTSAGAETSAGATAPPGPSAPKGSAAPAAKPPTSRQPQPVTIGAPPAARSRTPWLLIGGLLVGAGVLVYVLASPPKERR